MAFHMYNYYVGKSTFNVIEKWLNYCFDGDLTRFRAEANYEILINKPKVRLVDFHNFIKKHFTLNSLRCIGY